ncbi:MAG: biotin--[acetyl-CoA-carboxylase] ligase [Rhodospirillales bacterium]|nr:biotin--[acetyl-CoA-carboxylase] ligase [Alphaproteobacteria bacterium]USO03283.1 MAG: biotin--[acetyl-CoA-carboxylase] ligase [Rhodospirillales bacterium]
MGIDWRVNVVGSASSTQDLAQDAAEAGTAEGYVIQALQQTAGRGRHGNDWLSPMGNLYLSFVLRPERLAPGHAGQLAFVTAVALSDAMGAYLDPERHCKTLKWPNDILVDGLKISGILLESNIKNDSEIEYLVVGVGVNVFAPPEGAAGLDALKEKPVYVNVFRDDFLACFAESYGLWREKGFAPIREEWLKQAHGLNGPMSVRFPEVSYSGIFDGLDESGALLLDQEGRTRTFTAGEVYFGNV